MIFSIYGVSRSGKDYLIQRLKEYFGAKGKTLIHVNGSATLDGMAERKYSKRFKHLAEEEKNELRRDFIDHVRSVDANDVYIVVDGHYALYENNAFVDVFTEFDLECYEKFFYLDTAASDVVLRMRSSAGEKKNTVMTEDDVRRWQDYEIASMTQTLIKADKELHIVKYESDFCLEYIFDALTGDKYDSRVIASKMLEGIEIPFDTVVLTDCDKTLSKEDSTSVLLDNIGVSKEPLKAIFDGDRYSNYQMELARRYCDSAAAFTPEAIKVICERITVNDSLIGDLKEKTNATVLAITSGNTTLWQSVLDKCGLSVKVLKGDGLVSKYVKYYVAKQLRDMGKFVVAIGDSLLDSMMLTEANVGYLATKGYRANVEAFVKTNPQIRQLSYFDYKYEGLRTDETLTSIKALPITPDTEKLIDVCKSDLGAMGRRLRAAHKRLGALVSEKIICDYPNEKFAVVIMMRSGLCFGEGIADALDAPVIFCYGKGKDPLKEQLEENPQLKEYRFILSDGVINTGETILKLAESYRDYSPIIAANVISSEYRSGSMIPIYVSRISKNSYKGAKRKTISNGEGPDTSDRLFKLL